MTLSRSEQILQAIETLLASADGVNGRVFRDRWEALARNELPAIVLLPLSEDPQEQAIPFMDERLTVAVDILCSGAGLSTLADPIRVSAHGLLMADRSLGGLALDVLPAGTVWDAESGEIGVLRCRYRAQYRHLITDLTQ